MDAKTARPLRGGSTGDPAPSTGDYESLSPQPRLRALESEPARTRPGLKSGAASTDQREGVSRTTLHQALETVSAFSRYYDCAFLRTNLHQLPPA